jgi:NAD(P)-dependent dehydrogenase (short-subunit alcohol dehydrogenase family)
MTTSEQKPLALVTGASSGIGLELARQFGQNGFDLVIAAEDPGLSAAAADLRSTGADVQPVQVDLRTPDGVRQL